MKNRSKINKKY